MTSAGSEGDISFASVSGDVKLSQIEARGIEANSVSGGVTLAEVTCDRAKAKSVSGDIVFGGPLAKGGRYALQSHSGNVTVYTDGKMGFEVAAGTFSGDILSDLQLRVGIGGEGEGGQPGRRPKSGPGQRVRGTFGDGGAFLELGELSATSRSSTRPRRSPSRSNVLQLIEAVVEAPLREQLLVGARLAQPAFVQDQDCVMSWMVESRCAMAIVVRPAIST